jgi:cephalosporin-C deacetylase-like acetyl esterase
MDVCHAQQRSGPPSFAVSPDKSNGVYQVGETIRWRIEATGTNAALSAHYSLKKGEMVEVAQGDLMLTNGIAELESKADAPGHLMLEVRPSVTGGRGSRVLGGVIIAPEKITLSAPRPADFDSFWDGKLKEMKQVPARAKLERAEAGRTNIEYWKIMMDNIGGTHVYGQIARPAQGQKFPALLILQWAGVYSLKPNWVTDRAAQGWLALDIEPHDMAIDAGSGGAPGNYASVGNDDRDKSYFLRMYLSCYQAARYLTQRPDWNGQTLVVMGDSMGGQQSLVIAGLFPKITAALALVPSGCDTLGPESGRREGYPGWYDNAGGKDPRKVHEASRYFDTANFTARIQGQVLVAFGLLDETSPPTGVLAAFNQIKSPKQMLILTRSPHQDAGGAQAPYRHLRDDVWLPALKEGKRPPVNPVEMSAF